MSLLSNPYTLGAIALGSLGALAGAFGAGWHFGGNEAEGDLAEYKAKGLEATIVAQKAEIDRGLKGNAELLRRIELLPPITATTREVVYANPSSCRVPAPVHASVLQSVAAANKALTSK